ncbi:MAG: hypothetical protein WBK96_13690 [Candidatus Manganitrophaceae bacterium]
MATEEYIFDNTRDQAELVRLKAIEAAFDPQTKIRLESTGLSKGWRCLEIGPGAGWDSHTGRFKSKTPAILSARKIVINCVEPEPTTWSRRILRSLVCAGGSAFRYALYQKGGHDVYRQTEDD